ncbi:MAG: DUF892 family protein [Pedobacter sp.]|nr:MAG: DUF892 family protein [Pedobacter sp.]
MNVNNSIRPTSMLFRLFMNCLNKLLWAEQQSAKLLPKVENALLTTQMVRVAGDHAMYKVRQIARLKQVFHLIQYDAEPRVCSVMEGLIKELKEVLRDSRTPSLTRDAAIVMVLQKITHHEMSVYSSLISYIKMISFREVCGLLETTLDEEVMINNRLTLITVNKINWRADSEMTQEEKKLSHPWHSFG